MVLCYSRMLYVEFTLSETMEHFLACHQHAFEYFSGAVPAKLMVDNLKSAVLQRQGFSKLSFFIGEMPIHPRRRMRFHGRSMCKITFRGIQPSS
jgi:transposase